MKRFNIILIAIIAFLCLVQAVAALTTVGGITTSPSQVNTLKTGDIVSEVSGTLKLPPSGGLTFPVDDKLEFYTQLDNAKWSVIIVQNGIDNPAMTFNGKHATIGGFMLSYPASGSKGVELNVKFSMTGGVVPSSFTSGDIILVRALELDSSSNQVGAPVFKNGTVINPEAMRATLNNVKAKLVTLKADIDAKEALGVDTTAARAKYQAASSALDTAATNIISSPTTVQSLLDTATSNINNANAALDQAWAQESLNLVKVKIASVEGLIKEFTVNRSLKLSDSRLVPITNKFDLAVTSKNDAQVSFDQGTYTTARSDASEALGYANDAWNLSVDLKTELDKGFSLPGLPDLGAFLPILLVAAVVLIIAGIIIYRKKTQWDELG